MISFCNKKLFSTTSSCLKLNIEKYIRTIENPSPHIVYKQLLQENQLQLDDKQTSTISILDSLHYKLSGYKNSIRTQSIFNKVYFLTNSNMSA